MCATQGGTAIETSNSTPSYWYWGDNNGEDAAYTHQNALTSPESFKFRSGIANINVNGSVKVGGGFASETGYGNWIGANGNAATLNVNGGTFWSYAAESGNPKGVLRVGVNGGVNDATINLNSGVLRVDGVMCIGGTLYSSYAACAKNGIVNIGGGTAEIATLNLGTDASKAGSNGGGYTNATLNLTGGTLEVKKFNFNAYHSQYFTWGGGTVRATAANVFSSTAPLAGCTRSVNVTGNPAVFDTGNFAQTLPADIASGSGTLKLTGGNTVTLSTAPSFGLWLDGTTLAFASGFGSSLTVPSVTLGSGASIVCDADSLLPGSSFTLTSTGGFALPDGGAVLDCVQIGGNSAADCEKSLSADGKTVTVSKPGDPNFIWGGGNAANWGDVGAWTNDGAAATWADGNNAIFSTANATATLNADVSALSVVFDADATIGGQYVLTVPTVSVANGVSGAISAPTAGALEKTGAGTLVLSQNRIGAATTLTEGTLALSGTAALDWSSFTLGTDPAKPVTLRFGENAMLSDSDSTWYVGRVANVTSTVCKAGGDWTMNGSFSIGTASGANAIFRHDGGSLTINAYTSVGSSYSKKSLSTLIVSGGAVSNSYATAADPHFTVGGSSDGVVVVTNGAALYVGYDLLVGAQSGTTGTLDVFDGTVEAAHNLIFAYNDGATGIVNIRSGGVLSVQNVYRRAAGGSATFNFDGGTIRKRRGSGDIFAASGVAVSIGANGGTIDNNGLAVTIPCTMTGVGALTLAGSGTTKVSADQSYAGTTTVSTGTTLAAAGVAFAGAVALETGSALDIADYGGDTSLAATSLIFPVEGMIPLTHDGGAFPVGVYAICSASGVTAATGAKFVPSTGGETFSWSVNSNKLILTVGAVPGNYWTGLGGDSRMSTAGNWAGGVPAAGADVDFSGISSACTIIADANRTFGAVTMGSGVITFEGVMTATSFSDTSKIAVGADSTVTVEGDLEFSSNGAKYICCTFGTGGTFAVLGDIVMAAGTTGTLYPCAVYSSPGRIVAKGLVNNQTDKSNANDYGRTFMLARSGQSYIWEIGENGFSGSNYFHVPTGSGSSAKIKAGSDFKVADSITSYSRLELDTAGRTITLGTNTTLRAGGIFGGGTTTISGSGKVVANYDVDTLTSTASALVNPFVVTNTATLAMNPGADLGSGGVTVCDGAMLEVAESGMMTLGGDLTLANGAKLGFNFTNRGVVPAIALASGKSLCFAEGVATNIVVNISGTVSPVNGEKVLTSCGGFNSDGVSVSLPADAPRWAGRITVNASGDIVLFVKPTGTIVFVR